MSFKRIFVLFLFFIFAFSVKCFAEEYPFDMTNVVRDFNEYEYVKKLNAEGNKIYAVERTNRYTLRYNNLELTYTYDEAKHLLHTEIELGTGSTDDLLLLNALFIDSISTMQGKEPGLFLCYALDDYFFYTLADQSGVGLELLKNSDGKTVYDFKIDPFVRFIPPISNNPIPRTTFTQEYDTLYEDTNTFIYYNDLVVLKYFDDTGKLVIYVGESKSNSERSKKSVETLIELIVSTKSSVYFDKNVADLSNNYDSEALKVEANLDSLPFTETRALVMPHEMKYAKITIDRNLLKKVSEEMSEEPEAKVGDITSFSSSKVPLVSAIVIIGMVFIIILIGIIKRRHD